MTFDLDHAAPAGEPKMALRVHAGSDSARDDAIMVDQGNGYKVTRLHSFAIWDLSPRTDIFALECDW